MQSRLLQSTYFIAYKERQLRLQKMLYCVRKKKTSYVNLHFKQYFHVLTTKTLKIRKCRRSFQLSFTSLLKRAYLSKLNKWLRNSGLRRSKAMLCVE